MYLLKGNATENFAKTTLDHNNFQVVLFFFLIIYFVKECNLKLYRFFYGLSIAFFLKFDIKRQNNNNCLNDLLTSIQNL